MKHPRLYKGDVLFGKMIYYVHIGEMRPPKKGEYFLSGAIPTVYTAPHNLTLPHQIMREATKQETHCECCGQFLSSNVKGG